MSPGASRVLLDCSFMIAVTVSKNDYISIVVTMAHNGVKAKSAHASLPDAAKS